MVTRYPIMLAIAAIGLQTSHAAAQVSGDLAASVSPQLVQLSLDGVRSRPSGSVAAHISPRLTFPAPWGLGSVRVEAPSVELSVNHFKGISLVHPDTGFSYFDVGTRIEWRPTPQFGLYWRGARGTRTMERIDSGAPWNYIGSGRSSAIGLFIATPRFGDRGLSIQVGNVAGDYYEKENAGINRVSLARPIDLTAVTYSLEWSGHFTGADLPPIPLFSHERMWSTRIENDAFGGTNSDSAYTQGLQTRWDVSFYNPVITRLMQWASATPFFDRRDAYTTECGTPTSNTGMCTTVHFGFAQTEYTPDTLQIDTLMKAKRPYAGYLYAFAGASEVFNRGRIESQIQIGTTGKHALGEDAQSLAHWTWAARRPRPAGWSNQLAGNVQMMLVTQYEFEPLRACWGDLRCTALGSSRAVDITLRGQTDWGTVMNRVSPGAALRFGVNYPDASTFQRVPVSLDGGHPCKAAVLRAPYVAGVVGGDLRFVLSNGLVDGTYADRGGWSEVKQIEATGRTNEWSWGVQAGWGFLGLAYQRVTRSAEYTPNGGPHHFGALMIGIVSSCS